MTKKKCNRLLIHFAICYFIAEPNIMVHLLTVLTNVCMIHFNVHTKHCRYIYTIAFQTQLNAIFFYGSYNVLRQFLSSVKHPNCTLAMLGAVNGTFLSSRFRMNFFHGAVMIYNLWYILGAGFQPHRVKNFICLLFFVKN